MASAVSPETPWHVLWFASPGVAERRPNESTALNAVLSSDRVKHDLDII